MSIHASERITTHLTDLANLVGQLESELNEAHTTLGAERAYIVQLLTSLGEARSALEAEHARAEQDRNGYIRNGYTRTHNKRVFKDQRDYIAELTTKLGEAQSDAKRYKGDCLNACKTIATMHEAATGRHGEAATRGVVEDVEDMKTMLDHAQQRIKNVEEAIRETERLELSGHASRIRIALAVTRNPSKGH